MTEQEAKLNENSLGLSESIIMGVAGTAPAYSIAATTGVLVAAVGYNAIASLLYCGLVMFGVTLSFLHLNRMNTNAGASFIWVGEVFNPVLGFLAGWSLLVAAAVFMVAGTFPAAVATLGLLAPNYIRDPIMVSFVASLWLLFVSAIVLKGIKLSSYFQMILTFIEVGILAVIIGAGLWFYGDHPVKPFSVDQLSLLNFSPATFAAGALTSLFFFWGWDVTVNLSEETKDAKDNPGKGAVGAMFIVLLLFIGFMLAAQMALSLDEIKQADSNLILALAKKVLPGSLGYIAVIAVMLSTVGTLETTILQFTRTLYAKGRHGVLNPRYAKLHKTWKTPWFATLIITSIGLFLLLCAAFFQSVERVIVVSVEAIGFQVAFYYGLTCLACAWQFRYIGFKNFSDFIILKLWPLISGLFMVFIFAYCAVTLSYTTTLLGIGGILVGLIPLWLNRKNKVTR
jgi:amino acid transporter